MTGIVILIVALAVATAVGVLLRVRPGKIQSFDRTDGPASPVESASAGGTGGRPPGANVNVLTEADLGAALGDRATLVQLSTEFCAYCGPTRKLLAGLAAAEPGVGFIEVDAAERMDLTRRLKVFSTPTVFVLRPDGGIAARSTGKPQKADLAQSLRSVLNEGVRS